MRRRILPTLLAAAAVAWMLWAFGMELGHAFGAPADDPRPARWSLRSPEVEELRGLLAEADGRLPAGSLVAVTSPWPPGGPQEFFFSLWCAYLLPRHDVVRASQPWALKRADSFLAHRAVSGAPQIEPPPGRAPVLVFEHPAGSLYRLAP